MKVISANKNVKKENLYELPHLVFKKVKMSIDKKVMLVKVTLPHLEKDNYFAKIKDGTLKISLMTKKLVIDRQTKSIAKTKLKNVFLTGFLVLPSSKYEHIKNIKKIQDTLVLELTELEISETFYQQNAKTKYVSA